MAKRLTEEMVIARSKFSDLSKVKRLNCWGSELVDVSVLRKMPCVEVLSLSINKINSLADFQYCLALQELYIRQNDIRDLNQICYLQGLPGLKHLWLGENPCAATEEYRLTVLRTLPQIQKLDNVVVTQDELREASRKGRILCHPEDPQESEEDEYPQNQQWYQEYPADKEYSPQRSPPQHEPDYENEETKDYYSRDDGIIENRDYSPPQSQASPPRKQEPHRQSYSPEQEYTDKRTNNYDQEYSRNTQCYDKSPPNNNNFYDESVEVNYRDIKLTSSQSTTSIKDFTNGEKYSSSQHSYRHSDGIELSAHLHDISQRPREKFTCPATHQPPFNRRPVTRNSNILSAVLCLVKELDYPSLEVVEMAVRCRMDELEE